MSELEVKITLTTTLSRKEIEDHIRRGIMGYQWDPAVATFKGLIDLREINIREVETEDDA